ncbi:MAG: protein-glutamate O-methyltransferase CheR [Alicyclobacillus sp.]|nr:protein-glutamate O-methyltransferase CheR [Alicyclobacillus sp.]
MDEYLLFVAEFLALTGIDLTQYKRQQMERRLTAFRSRLGYHSFRAFSEALKRDEKLLAKTLDQMTINVSEFFRNPDRWQVLFTKLEKPRDRELRIWSAGCASGEEPYTIAMLMEEHRYTPYRIWATDIDPRALQTAAAGIYTHRQLSNVPQAYLHKYFSHQDGTWRVDDRLRGRIHFRRHNLLADRYPVGFDLIVCRNVLIYFTDEAKQEVIQRFSDSLSEGGWLFVGSTEQFLMPGRFGLQAIMPFVYRKLAT